MRAYGALRCIMRSKSTSMAMKMAVYKSIIRPAILYGSSTWTLTKKSSRTLAAVDNTIIRRIAGAEFNPEINKYVLRI